MADSVGSGGQEQKDDSKACGTHWCVDNAKMVSTSSQSSMSGLQTGKDSFTSLLQVRSGVRSITSVL